MICVCCDWPAVVSLFGLFMVGEIITTADEIADIAGSIFDGQKPVTVNSNLVKHVTHDRSVTDMVLSLIYCQRARYI